MIELKIEVDGLKETRAWMDGMAESMPKIEYYARINTAEKMRDRLKKEINTVFDRPIPLIQNAVRVSKKTGGAVGRERTEVFGRVSYSKKALPQDRTVVVGLKDNIATKRIDNVIQETLYPHVHGVRRGPKSSELRLRDAHLIDNNEFLVPARTLPVNKYGNVRGPMMVKILSDLQAFKEKGYNANRNLLTAGRGKFFIAAPGGQRAIFKMTGRGGRGMQMYFLIVKGAPKYQKRFDFYGIAEREYNQRWDKEFSRVYERQVKKKYNGK